MRIILANHTPVSGSGSGTYTAMLARGLAQAGHEICVLTPQAEQFPMGAGIETCSVERLRQDFPSFTGHPLSSRTYGDLDQGELELLQEAWLDAFDGIREQWDPDIVHVQHLWVVAKAAAAAGFRSIVTCHGSEVDFALGHPNIARFLLPEPNQLGAVISVSNYVAQKTSSILQQAPLIRYTLLNPYNGELFYFEPGRFGVVQFPHLGFVGRLAAYKNCEQFLECIACLRKLVPELRASVIGDGPDRGRLESLAEELDLLKVVRFLGQLDQERLPYHYQCFDALIVPSHNEPFGLVALEVVACGTPAIVARSGGLRELIHPPFILGYESNDLSDLTARVMEVLGRPHDVEFSVRANDYVQRRYSLTNYVQQLESIYKTLEKLPKSS